MTIQDFDQLFIGLMQREPFRNFTVELAGEQRFEVDDPYAMVVRDGTAVYLKSGGGFVWFNHRDVMHVNS